MPISYTGWRRYLVAGWAFVETLLFGGLLYGWGSLVFVLKEEGIYRDLCPESKNGALGSINTTVNESTATNGSVPYNTDQSGVRNGSEQTASAIDSDVCKPQDQNMALCFAIASALFCCSCFFMGQINFKFGTRVTRIIAMIIFVAGSLMLAFVNKDVPWLIYPGLSLLGTGGLPLLVTNAQISNLFPGSGGSSSFVGILCGGFDVSSAMQLMVKLAYQNGIARKISYIFITVLHSMVLVSTFCFLPKDFIPQQRQQTTEADVASGTEVAVELLKKKEEVENGDGDNEHRIKFQPENVSEKPTLLSCVKKPVFLLHCGWLCILQLRFYYFIGTLNTYLSRTLDNDNTLVSHFTDVCFYTMMGGLLTSFLSGIVYDRQKTLFQNNQSHFIRQMMPAVLPLCIGSGLGIILSILVLIPIQNLLYVIFIIMTLFRSFLYSLGAAFLSAVFPSEYFGLLYGIMIIAGGLFGLLQYGFFTWSEAYPAGPEHANIFLLCLTAVSFIHPVYIWISCRRAGKNFSM